MKLTISILHIIWFCLALSVSIEAQKPEGRGLSPIKQQRPAQNRVQSQKQAVYKKTVYYFRRKMNSTDPSATSLQMSDNKAQLVEGVISGTIVQRGPADMEQFNSQKYNAKFRLTDGTNVKTIDERGVCARGFTTVIEVGSSLPLDEALILDYLNKFANENKGKQLEFRFDSLKDNSRCFVATAIFGEGAETDLDELPLLGELQQSQGKSRIMPSLKVTSEKGLVRIPVNQVAPLKKRGASPRHEDQQQDKQTMQATERLTASQMQKGRKAEPQGEIYCFLRKTSSTPAASSDSQVSRPKGVQLIEGEIKGLIAQRIATDKVSAAGYRLTKGKDIIAIDEEGVHVRGISTVMIAANDDDNKPINDLALIEEAAQTGQLRLGKITKNEVSTTIAVKPVEYVEGVKTEETALQDLMPVLGELRCDGGCRILPRLEIDTIKGVVAIPVGKIVKFTHKNR